MKLGRRNILIVDDSRLFLMYTSILLERMGFNVILARSGMEALKFTKILGADLVLLDVVMPQMDGIKILEYIKADPKISAIPVIMMSVISDDGTVERCKNFGCADYITKPLKITELHSALQNIMHSRRRHLRIDFNKEVLLSYNGRFVNCFGETLSEGGVYIETNVDLHVGSLVNVTLPLNGKNLSLCGVIIYKKGADSSLKMPGLAIEFQNLSDDDSIVLGTYIKDLLGKDIIERQYEKCIVLD